MIPTRILTGAIALMLLAGCGKEAGVPGETPEESAELNNAAEMLDASPDGLAAPEDMPIESESNDSTAPTGNSGE